MVLEVENITKEYAKNRGAADVTLTLAEGEILGLLGPNGSGKTTLMKIIVGLVKAQRGFVRIFGFDIKESRAEALSQVGAIIEDPSVIPYLSAYDNLKRAAAFYPDARDPDEVLSFVGLLGVKKSAPRTFSLGMRQRLGLALAIIGKPKLLIMDEPTNGLDIEGSIAIRNMIKNSAAHSGAAVLISSHIASDLQQICTRAAIMKNARIRGVESMPQITQNHGTLENYYIDTVKLNLEGVND